MIFGNSAQQTAALAFLRSGEKILCLEGDPHLGKASFLRREIPALFHEEDTLFAVPDPSGAREACEFASTEPVHGSSKVLVIEDIDSLSDPTQDAYLKLFEEPPASLRVVLTATDLGRLNSALRSRVRRTIRWVPLSSDEMQVFIQTIEPPDQELAAMVAGRPGIYVRAHGKQRYKELFRSVTEYVTGHRDPFMDPVPSAFEKLSDPDDRSVVSHLCRFAAVRSGGPAHRIRTVLEFCSTLSSIPSANAAVHWTIAAVQMSSSL